MEDHNFRHSISLHNEREEGKELAEKVARCQAEIVEKRERNEDLQIRLEIKETLYAEAKEDAKTLRTKITILEEDSVKLKKEGNKSSRRKRK